MHFVLQETQAAVKDHKASVFESLKGYLLMFPITLISL